MNARARSWGRVLLGAILIAAAVPASAEDGPSSPAATAPAPHAGMRVFVDPDTGERTAPPAAPGAALSGAAALSAKSLGLVEEVNPRGGYVINLRQRFRGAAKASVAADGEISAQCEAGATEAQP